ncbi:hypothetical protein T492DRAFT_839263 [Pavlovales sp. CCMP2436]|nr:hypothetical protein T492DRAFT_839263 [Pavlovales sp. CCMP2436]
MLATFFEAALLVGAIYCVGASELDPRVTVLILLAITLLLASITRRQRERAAKAELIRATGTGSQVRASMTAELINSLPSWVTFPDTERADWLNTWIHKLWPYLNVATEDTMKACLNPILERIVKGTPIRRMLFTKFSLGGTPLNVTGVRCHHRGSHAEIVLDMDVSLAGQPDVQLEVGVSSYACVPVVLSQLQLIGTLRVIFSPLCTDWPCFACISIGFVRQPAVDCRLSVANNAFDVMSLPGVSDALLKLITVSLANYFTWPNFVSIPLADNYEADPNIAISMGLKGLLELELVAASGVKRPPSGKEARGGNAVESAMSMLANLQPIKPYLTVSQGGEAVRFRVSKEHSAVAREVLLGVLCEQLIDHPGSDELTVCLWSDQLNDVLLGTHTHAHTHTRTQQLFAYIYT